MSATNVKVIQVRRIRVTDFYLKNSINNAQEMATCKNGHLLSEMLERALIGQGST